MKTQLLLLMMLLLTGASTAQTTVDKIIYLLNNEEKTATVLGCYTEGFPADMIIPAKITVEEINYDVVEVAPRGFLIPGMNSVTIPSSILLIGNATFMDMKHVYCKGSTPPQMPKFGFCTKRPSKTISPDYSAILHVPKGCRAAYESADNWKYFSLIVEEGESDIVKTTVTGAKYGMNPNNQTASLIGYDKNVPANLFIPDAIGENNEYKVTTIGATAFTECTNLKSVTIGNNVSSIEYCAFLKCTNLTSVTFGEKVSLIGNYVFQYAKLEHIYCLNKKPADISDGTFLIYDAASDKMVPDYSATLHVPQGCKATYQSAKIWENFTNILEDAETAIENVQQNDLISYSNNQLIFPPYKGITEVTVYTPAGTLITRHHLQEGESCYLNALPSGIYIIKVKTGEKTITAKIIK